MYANVYLFHRIILKICFLISNFPYIDFLLRIIAIMIALLSVYIYIYIYIYMCVHVCVCVCVCVLHEINFS